MTKTLWVKLSVDYMDDPKIVAAGHRGELLFVRGLAYAKKTNTPSIPAVMMPRLCIGIPDVAPDELANVLIQAGLWAKDDNGYRIVAWEAWQSNDTKRQSAGGTLAMHNRWHKTTQSASCPHCIATAGQTLAASKPTKEPKQAMMFLPEVLRACKQLADHMVANGAKEPNINDAWLTEMDKLNRIDGRAWEDIEAVIDWCQRDSFWRTNILSPAKLRKQFDQLKLKMAAPVRNNNAAEAEQAWAEVIGQIRSCGYNGSPQFSTDRIRQTVRSVGWRNLCQSREEVGKAQFIRAYNEQPALN